MGAIPSYLGRVPTLLASQVNLRQVSGTNADLLRTQTQLTSLKRVNRPSDDPVASTLIDRLNRDIASTDQRERNLTHASSTLNTIDQVIGQLTDSVRDAKQVASSQVGVGSDTATRRQQASVIDATIQEVFAAMNRDYAGIQLFGGSATATRPISQFNGAFRYHGEGEGLVTDLGDGVDVPITIAADLAVGALSARVQGAFDLNPRVTPSTKVSDLRGNALGQTLGSLTVNIDPGTGPVSATVDLSNAETVGDVADLIESAIRQTVPGALTGAYPAGVDVLNNGLGLNIAAGHTITFTDGPSGTTAQALSLSGFTFNTASPFNTNPGSDLNPVVTDETQLGDLLPASAVAYGGIVLTAGGRSGTVTTSATMTVGEFKEAVKRLNLGVRVEVSSSGDTINVLNELAGQRLSISESTPGAASSLGIRSILTTTPTKQFNDGKGIEIADGVLNPLTGLPDPAKNVDFRVTLSNGASFDVDLVPGDLGTVQDVLNRINTAAAAAGQTIGTGAGQFQARLSATGNGIELSDTHGGPSAIVVAKLNGRAAEDLGLLDAKATTGTPATLAGSDRTSVRVDSLFSTLIELRNALQNDDVRGITLAGGRLDADLERLATAQATVGGRAKRVEDAVDKLKDTDTLNKSVKSQLEDLDVIEASGRFALLQTQLQAGYSVVSQTRQLSLINFLR
jgi:flagellin-like hook-associated protein FlgL